MGDTNIKIIVGGQNDSRTTFDQVKRDLTDVRKEAEKPIVFGPVKPPRFDSISQEIRDRLAGQTRGLRDRADVAERAARLRSATGLDDLTSGALIREENDRFRLTAGTRGGGGAGGFDRVGGGVDSPSIRDKYGMLAAKLVALRGVMRLAEAGVEALDVAFAKPNTRQAAEGYIKLSESLGRIPIVGQFALLAADKLTGGALEAAKKALDDADAIDKHTDELKKKLQEKIAARTARGDTLIESGQRDVSDTIRRGVTDPFTLAKIALQDDLAKAAKLRKDAKELDPNQEKKVNAQANDLEIAARKKFEADKADIQTAADKDEREKRISHGNAIRKIDDDTLRLRLQNQGEGLKAKIQAIRDADKDEIDEAKRKGDQDTIVALKLRESQQIRQLREEDAAAHARAGLDVLKGLKSGDEVKGATPFSGESRLLTGVGSSLDTLVQPTNRMDKNLAALSQQQKADAGRMIDLLTIIAANSPVLAGPF